VNALGAPAIEARGAGAAGVQIESVQRRYTATLFAQVTQMAVSAIAAGIVPRALGSVAFGNYNFLINMAATLRGFTEPSIQQAFFTLSSSEERSGTLTRVYAVWVALQLLIILLLLGAATVFGWTGGLWPGQQMDQILLITLVDWATFLVASLKQLGDSKALTVRPQMIGAVSSVFVLAGLVTLAGTGHLTFYTFASLNLAAGLLTSVGLTYWLLVVHGERCWLQSAQTNARRYLRAWWAYAKPLIAVEYYTPLVAILSTYLIQIWYGSREQGQLALALRWSSLVLLFSGSATSIVWRELAAAVGAGDRQRASDTYRAFSNALVFMTAALSAWLAVGSGPLVITLAGPDFRAAVPVLAIMAFYPLQQVFGQVNGAALKATGRTGVYGTIRVALSVPEALLTYWLLAPRHMPVPGLELGARGVALRMVVFGLLGVQLFEWASARHLGLSYLGLLKSRAAVIAPIAVLAIMLWLGGGMLTTTLGVDPMVSFALSSLAYAAGVLWLALGSSSRRRVLLEPLTVRRSS
jgi:O-antigen/teichoic acid export membrane protein